MRRWANGIDFPIARRLGYRRGVFTEAWATPAQTIRADMEAAPAGLSNRIKKREWLALSDCMNRETAFLSAAAVSSHPVGPRDSAPRPPRTK